MDRDYVAFVYRKGNDGDVPDGTLLLLHGAFFGTTAGGYGTLFEVSQ